MVIPGDSIEVSLSKRKKRKKKKRRISAWMPIASRKEKRRKTQMQQRLHPI
jgi:hypothetical protein